MQNGMQNVSWFRTQMKVLYFDRSGYCVWSKRLERGRFQSVPDGADKLALDWTRLKLLLEGIDLQERRQYKRYSHTQGAQAGV
jgi:transposase